MDSTSLIASEAPTLLSVASEDGQKENATRAATLEASVAFATELSTTEYSTESNACQVSASPTLAEIEAAIADAARKRIESAHRELTDTHERIERERAARDHTQQAAQERASQTQSALDGLADERAALENRARAFLGGEELQAMLGKIHLAFNARQLELEDTLAVARTDEAEAQEDIQAADLTDALELQLAEQEVERLETAAPETAKAIRQAESVSQLLAAARQALEEGLLRDVSVLLDQAKAANADSSGSAHTCPGGRCQGDKQVEIVEAEQALAEAKQAQLARDLIARIKANADQPGALKRIGEMMREAQAAGVADKVAPYAERAWQIARNAANARFGQARPVADHLAKEGFVPVIGDGRIEVWKKMSRNGASGSDHQSAWKLDHILTLRGNAGWATEKPRVPITRKTLSPHVMRSRWYRLWAANQRAATQPDAASDQPS